MSLIDKSYFTGTINIDTGKSDTQILLAAYITDSEAKYLTMLLGEDLYYDYTQNPTVQKYVDLITGKVYVDNGISKNYTGVKQMLAYFTWHEFQIAQISFSSVLGEASGMSVNSTIVEPTMKLVNAWNAGADLFRKAQKFITWANTQNPATYENYLFHEISDKNTFSV